MQSLLQRIPSRRPTTLASSRSHYLFAAYHQRSFAYDSTLKSLRCFSSTVDTATPITLPNTTTTTITERPTSTTKRRRRRPSRIARPWDDYYTSLVAFQKEHGHTNVPSNYSPDPSLSAFCRKQKQNRPLQSPTQTKLLEEIHFDWETHAEKLEKQWQEKFERLKQYKDEHNGSTNVPKKYDQDPALGFWVDKQRYNEARGLLLEHRYEQLEEIAFQWTLHSAQRDTKSYDKKWNTKYEQLVEYYRREGHTVIQRSKGQEHNKKLANWVAAQRGLFHKGLLRHDRQIKLEAIDFVWAMDQTSLEETVLQHEWEDMYERLEEYQEEHEPGSIPPASYKPHGLGTWVATQKRRHKAGRLEQSRLERLSALGFQFTKTREELWQENYEKLKTYRDQHGNCLVPKSDIKHRPDTVGLANWVTTQRTYYRRGLLSPERIAKLDALGFTWDARTPASRRIKIRSSNRSNEKKEEQQQKATNLTKSTALKKSFETVKPQHSQSRAYSSSARPASDVTCEELIMVPPFLRESSPKKIAVALSGGVDSSVVAYLVQQLASQHELLAVHMSNWNTNDEDDPYCTKDRDWKDAQAVARQLGLPLHPASFVAEYWTEVFEPFTVGVEAGRRGNPDVHCNRYIKFGALQDFVKDRLKADVLATGHYARLWHRAYDNNHPYSDLIDEMLQADTSLEWVRTWGQHTSTVLSPLLLTARDRSKCQSLFLSAVPGSAFHNVIFPLGDLLKKKPPQNSTIYSSHVPTVREIAELADLPTAGKKDSMGICFIGKRPGGFNEFIEQYFAESPLAKSASRDGYQFINVDTGAPVANEEGTNTAKHMVYAPGQRARISGAAEAWFVVETDPSSSKGIMVCQGTHHPALYTDLFYIRDLHWMVEDLPTPLCGHFVTETMSNSGSTTRKQLPVLHAKCRIRNLQPLLNCRITYDAADRLYTVITEKPLRAVTPGQHCAFYVGQDGLVCLGGGTIWEKGPTYHEENRVLDVSNLHPSGHNDTSLRKKT